MSDPKSEDPSGELETKLNQWGRLLERAMREADPVRYQFKKEHGYLMSYLIEGQNVMQQMYRIRIEEGEEPESARESVLEDYAEQMTEEEMSEEYAEMVVTQWLDSQETGQ